MAFEKDIVDVSVAISGRPIDQAGFETPLFLAAHSVFAERTRRYSSATAAASDGFAEGSPVFEYLSRVFAGTYAPSNVVIGRKTLDDVDITLTSASVVEDEVFSIPVKADGTSSTLTYTVIGTELDVDAIATAIAGLAGWATLGLSASATGSVITVTATTATSWSVGVSGSNYDVANNSVETITTALTAVDNEDSNYYFMSEDSHITANQDAMADYASTVDKFFVYSTSDSSALSSGNTTNIGYLMQQKSYEGAVGWYSATADKEYLEGAIIGQWAGVQPGVTTLQLKTLTGVTVDNITESQKAALQGYNLNYYVTTYGNNVTQNGGVTGSDFFADTIRFKHWLKARVGEEVFTVMKRESDLGRKVEMSSVGFAKIRQAIDGVLQLAIRRGAALADPVPVIRIPTRDEISEADRAARFLPDVVFEITSSGAVNSVRIRGFVLI